MSRNDIVLANKLESKLRTHSISKVDTKEKIGVDKITCNECLTFYIGKQIDPSKKYLNIIYQQLKKMFKKSNYTVHIINNCHKYKDDNTNMDIFTTHV